MTQRVSIGLRLIVAALAVLAQAGVATAHANGRPTLVASSKIAVVSTQSGQVQGFIRRGIFTYRGLPYASAERFSPPTEHPRWSGVRPALSYGNICPQPVSPELREPQTFISDTRLWPASEKCQNLNIWTPGIGGSKKRPVMVWLHGGGFFSGSSMELPLYDGTNLSGAGDVVVVSINHRLNALGFLDLSAYGPNYRESANVGMLDIVAALRWVQANIARFGGDAANVTIFGQSGGGAKVSTLLAAPSARGLFSKAIVQSGAPGSVPAGYSDRTVSRRVAAVTLHNLGIAPRDADRVRTIPYAALAAAADKALAAVSVERGLGTNAMGRPSLSWSPVVDGDFLPEPPFGGAAPATSGGVPLLIGSTISEFMIFPDPRLRQRATWGEAEVITYLRETRGPAADAIYAAFRKAYPELAPNQLPLIDTMFRSAVLRTATLKAAQGDPVYSYVFAWRSPVLDYAWAGGHSSDLAFVFANADLGEQALGGGAVVERLARQVSQSWINFARTGNPNHAGLPRWPRFTDASPATMILDEQPDARVAHDAEFIRLLTLRPPQPTGSLR